MNYLKVGVLAVQVQVGIGRLKFDTDNKKNSKISCKEVIPSVQK